jgi:hypothetical protein
VRTVSTNRMAEMRTWPLILHGCRQAMGDEIAGAGGGRQRDYDSNYCPKRTTALHAFRVVAAVQRR